MSIKVLTDSACDMPAQALQKYEVELMPLYVVEGEKTYRDGIDITPEVLYEKMRRGVHYKTSQIPYADFVKRFTELAEEKQSFVYLSFSSGLSGTYQAAMLAKRDVSEKYPEVEMAVIDTKAVTGGLGLLMREIAEAAQNGADMAELIKLSSYYAAHVRHVFTVTDLEYLYRGGRLNKGTAIVGNMLKISPVLDVDENGELRQLDKARGEKKLLKKMIEYIEKNGDKLSEQTVYIAHADNLPLVESFVKLATKQLKVNNFEIMPMASIIGTHSGPGTLAVFFFDEIK